MSKEYLVRVIRIKDLKEMPFTTQSEWDEIKFYIKPGLYLCRNKETPPNKPYSVIYWLVKPRGTILNINNFFAELEEVDIETTLEETKF